MRPVVYGGGTSRQRPWEEILIDGLYKLAFTRTVVRGVDDKRTY
jgi:hypothetical protein